MVQIHVDVAVSVPLDAHVPLRRPIENECGRVLFMRSSVPDCRKSHHAHILGRRKLHGRNPLARTEKAEQRDPAGNCRRTKRQKDEIVPMHRPPRLKIAVGQNHLYGITLVRGLRKRHQTDTVLRNVSALRVSYVRLEGLFVIGAEGHLRFIKLVGKNDVCNYHARRSHRITVNVEGEIVEAGHLVVAHPVNIGKHEGVKRILILTVGRIKIGFIPLLHFDRVKVSVVVQAAGNARGLAVDGNRHVRKRCEKLFARNCALARFPVPYSRRPVQALNIADNSRIHSAVAETDFHLLADRKRLVFAHLDIHAHALKPIVIIHARRGRPHRRASCGARKNGSQ